MSRAPRILIYDPYLPALGGGERYAFAFAKALAAVGSVTLGGAAPDDGRLKRFGLEWPCEFRPMDGHRFTEASAAFDVAVVVTNGIPPVSRAERSVMVVQFPGGRLVDGHAPLTALSQRERVRHNYGTIIVYSEFVRRWLADAWGLDSRVISPPVDLGTYAPERKRNQILTVGRFFVGAHAKRHDALVKAFIELEQTLPSDWRFIVAGGAMDDAETRRYVIDVARAAAGHRIDLMVNASAGELQTLYGASKIYWHGTGFGRRADELEKAEHFGMTTVEAMSYGCVPVVYADGGQVEIVSRDTGGLWKTLDELGAITSALAMDASRLHHLAGAAACAARAHDFDAFVGKVLAVPEFTEKVRS